MAGVPLGARRTANSSRGAAVNSIVPSSFPLRNIWPGFAVDALFYACTYPIGESVICAECGEPVPNCTKVTA